MIWYAPILITDMTAFGCLVVWRNVALGTWGDYSEWITQISCLANIINCIRASTTRMQCIGLGSMCASELKRDDSLIKTSQLVILLGKQAACTHWKKSWMAVHINIPVLVLILRQVHKRRVDVDINIAARQGLLLSSQPSVLKEARLVFGLKVVLPFLGYNWGAAFAERFVAVILVGVPGSRNIAVTQWITNFLRYLNYPRSHGNCMEVILLLYTLFKLNLCVATDSCDIIN